MKSLRKLLGYSAAVIVSLCCVCSVGVIGMNAFNGSIISAPTLVQAADTPLSIEAIIELTYSAARTQTAIANPAPLFTATLVPAPIENTPTATVFIFPLQTSVAETNAVQATPTEYIFVTETPFSLATQQLQSTLPPQSAVCSCSIDYDCPEFSSHTEAQSCFDYCKSKGYGDVHGLDRDDDNLACEDTKY